jgi:hypothetical protein
MTHDPVNHPQHYTSLPADCPGCGRRIECIDVTKHLNFALGNAMKYLWRNGHKADAIEDLRKAKRYLEIEIARLEKAQQEVEQRRQVSDEFCDGAWAFKEGRSLDDNPLGRLEPGYLSWQLGWEAARCEKEPAAARIYVNAEIDRHRGAE